MRNVLRPVQVKLQQCRPHASAVGLSVGVGGLALYGKASDQPTAPCAKLLDSVNASVDRALAVASSSSDPSNFGAPPHVIRVAALGQPLLDESWESSDSISERQTTAAASDSGSSDANTFVPFWPSNGAIPTGYVLCPVMASPWPMVPVGFANSESFGLPGSLVVGIPGGFTPPLQDACTVQTDSPSQATAANDTSLPIRFPSRTGTSRRQRRRERLRANYAKHDLGAQAREARKCEELRDSVATTTTPSSVAEDTPQFWPATPESTPPQSPRGMFQMMHPIPMHQPTILTEPSGSPSRDLMHQLSTASAEERQVLLEQIGSSFWPMATSSDGCRAIQRAIEVADNAERAQLVEHLRGRVIEAAESPHANHVLQRCIEHSPIERIGFVISELSGSAAAVAKNRYGCRVLERIIEHFPTEQSDALLSEILEEAEKLCRHAFGNFIIQHVLEHGTEPQKQIIARILAADAFRLAKHRVASHVVKAALVSLSFADRQLLFDAFLSQPSQLADLAHHHCGSFVLRELKRASGVIN